MRPGLRSLIVGLIMTLFKLDERSRADVCRPGLHYVLLMLVLLPTIASAQIVEGLGSRALGMGGAFVAVANDSSATWWNPGALADGPFLDATIGFATTEVDDQRPASRTSSLKSVIIRLTIRGRSPGRRRATLCELQQLWNRTRAPSYQECE